MRKIPLFAFAVFCFLVGVESTSAGAAKTGTLAVTTVDTNGENIDAPITVAKGRKTVQEGAGSITATLPAGAYTVTFGELSGYAIKTPKTGKKTVMVKPLTGQSVVAVYSSTAEVWTLAKLPDTGQALAPYSPSYKTDGDYTINPPSYTDNGNGSVTDNVTTLVWQQQDDGTMKTWDEAKAYCDSLDLGGYTDWRLPTYSGELISIVYLEANYGLPFIDRNYFPTTSSTNAYWSSTTTYGSDTSGAWILFFFAGTDRYAKKSETALVRCVRGGQPFAGKVFTDNGNGTVIDNRTRLMWQQGEGGAAVYRDVQLNYCENLTLAGYPDWRLPNAKELCSILDFGKSTEPWIDARYFPKAHAGLYASSTAFPENPAGQYLSQSFGSDTSVYLRCVRGDGQ